MKITKEWFLLQASLGAMAWCYLLIGMYIRFQEEEIGQINYILGLSLSELANVRI